MRGDTLSPKTTPRGPRRPSARLLRGPSTALHWPFSITSDNVCNIELQRKTAPQKRPELEGKATVSDRNR